jgi:glycosyltransferase involved in cell wall biosynthesis
MPETAINIVHFHNGSGGGVLSVIRNLLRFSENEKIANHVIFTINKKLHPQFELPSLPGAKSVQIFYYSPDWNFYYTCKQLAKLLPGEEAIVVAHDWLELGMMSNLGLQNPCVFFLHGDYEYYYDLAKKHEKSIDLFFTVAQSIEQKLKQVIPQRTSDIYYLRFPVPLIPFIEKKKKGNIIFIGRQEEAKGYFLLPLIGKKLEENNEVVSWLIVGSSNNTNLSHSIWNNDQPVKFYGPLSNEKVVELLRDMQMIILPSLAEGMPVVIIEAMKAGVIPIVNDIDGGIRELVIDNETGYKIRNNEVNGYVEKIKKLINNNELAKKIQHNAALLANQLFEPINNTKLIEEKIIELSIKVRKQKVAFKAYGSRLDQNIIPNLITTKIREHNS